MYLVYIIVLSCHVLFLADQTYIIYGILAFQVFYFVLFELPNLIKDKS